MVRGLTRAWVEECESVSRAAAGVVTGLLSGAPLLTGRPSLHWERTGSGPPVLLIMGLGLSGGAWWRTVPVLAHRVRLATHADGFVPSRDEAESAVRDIVARVPVPL